MRLAAGHRLGHYEIVAFVGEGGMGEVYRARDTRLRRDVALKVLQTSAADSDLWARFEREAHSASALSHPNICTVHDFGEADGQPYLVMELIDGVSLRSAIQNQSLDPAAVVPIALQIADALEAAQANDIVHRDIKPGNVMITARGHVKVLDFGLAKLAAAATTGHTATLEPLTAAGVLLGTAEFLAPEILLGGQADARSDVWAFGVTLYQMVTGELPFKGATPFEISSGILRDTTPKLPPGVPSGLQRVIERCLEKIPADRYQHAGEIRAALQSLAVPSIPTVRARPARWMWIAALAAAAALATGVWIWRAPHAAAGPVTSTGAPASAIQEANDAYELAASLQRVQNEQQKAMAMYERALQIDPHFSEARRAHAFVYPLLLLNGYSDDLGLLYKAEEELQQVERETPDLVALPATQTLVYMAQGRKELVPAARLAEVAREHSMHPDTTIWRVVLLAFADDNATAKPLAQGVLQRQPLLAPMRMFLGEILRTDGDAPGAIREQQKVLEQAPTNITAIVFLTRAFLDNHEA